MDFLTVFLFTAFFVMGLSVYNRLVQKIRGEGDRVRSDWFELPDLLLACFLAGLFMLHVLHWFQSEETSEGAMEIGNVLPGVLPFLILVIGLSGFLRYRGVLLREFFGFDRLSPGRRLLLAAWLLLAASLQNTSTQPMSQVS